MLLLLLLLLLKLPFLEYHRNMRLDKMHLYYRLMQRSDTDTEEPVERRSQIFCSQRTPSIPIANCRFNPFFRTIRQQNSLFLLFSPRFYPSFVPTFFSHFFPFPIHFCLGFPFSFLNFFLLSFFFFFFLVLQT